MTTTLSDIASETADDTFTLYDLRVEVICPPGARIMCGAKPGDHFTLEGEMLRLPDGQGFSIYSLGMYVFRLLTIGRGAGRSLALLTTMTEVM